MLEREMRVKSCKEISDRVVHHIDGELKFNTCIGNFYSPGVSSLLEAYHRYDSGVLPYEGALMEQPNKVIEFFNIVERYKQDKIKAERQKQAQSQRSKGRRRGR